METETMTTIKGVKYLRNKRTATQDIQINSTVNIQIQVGTHHKNSLIKIPLVAVANFGAVAGTLDTTNISRQLIGDRRYLMGISQIQVEKNGVNVFNCTDVERLQALYYQRFMRTDQKKDEFGLGFQPQVDIYKQTSGAGGIAAYTAANFGLAKYYLSYPIHLFLPFLFINQDTFNCQTAMDLNITFGPSLVQPALDQKKKFLTDQTAAATNVDAVVYSNNFTIGGKIVVELLSLQGQDIPDIIQSRVETKRVTGQISDTFEVKLFNSSFQAFIFANSPSLSLKNMNPLSLVGEAASNIIETYISKFDIDGVQLIDAQNSVYESVQQFKSLNDTYQVEDDTNSILFEEQIQGKKISYGFEIDGDAVAATDKCIMMIQNWI